MAGAALDLGESEINRAGGSFYPHGTESSWGREATPCCKSKKCCSYTETGLYQIHLSLEGEVSVFPEELVRSRLNNMSGVLKNKKNILWVDKIEEGIMGGRHLSRLHSALHLTSLEHRIQVEGRGGKTWDSRGRKGRS